MICQMLNLAVNYFVLYFIQKSKLVCGCGKVLNRFVALFIQKSNLCVLNVFLQILTTLDVLDTVLYSGI